MKQHPTYSHLLISEDGLVYSTKSNKYLNSTIHPNGYRVFHTKLNGRKSKGILLRIHRLVAETYIYNTENKPFVNHKDGNKLNNHVSNLEWVTAKENSQHSWNNGLQLVIPRKDNPLCKITDEQLKEIKMRYIPYNKINGLRALAKEYNVSHTTLSRLVSGQSDSN